MTALFRNRIFWITIVGLFSLGGLVPGVYAQDSPGTPQISAGDTAWVLTSSALVLAMVIPGLALFYGGMVRSKNVLSTIMHSFIAVCVVSIVWVFWGYSLAFAPDVGGVVGGLQWLGLTGVGPEPVEGSTIPHSVFMVFQLMFAAITVALISGAIAERVKFSAFVLFAILWVTLIYSPLCHWVWGGGWLGELGALDFAGGTVVHISSGVAALACALVLGKRKGYGTENMAPHNLPLTVVGASLLWFGWFGFNAGSALAADGIAGGAFVATQVAAAAGALAWLGVEWAYRGKPTILGAASGAVAGLVAITPAAGFVGPISAIWIGLGGGVFCYLGVFLKNKMGYDDALDVMGIHGIGGTWGALATGLFASMGGGTGLFFGNPGQVMIQAIGVGATWIFVFAGTFLILKIVDGVVGLRVSKEEEVLGLDLTQHNERAYE
ncbi:MAG: ammonium transporter [Nitrospirales bacterium]